MYIYARILLFAKLHGKLFIRVTGYPVLPCRGKRSITVGVIEVSHKSTG